jgi:hypothetical protein
MAIVFILDGSGDGGRGGDMGMEVMVVAMGWS